MTVLNMILIVMVSSILYNLLYAVLLLFSFRGVEKIYLWFRKDSFLFLDSLGFIAFGASYHLAKKCMQ